jgi:hypothetical protein
MLAGPYRATTGEDTAGYEYLALAVMNFRVKELAKALLFFVGKSSKSPINPVTNPNLFSNH